LADLQRALRGSNAELVRASCAALGVSAEHRAGFTAQAEHIMQRANACVPAASPAEVALALGVLLTLFTAAPPAAELG
jgi:hypothetical protein